MQSELNAELNGYKSDYVRDRLNRDRVKLQLFTELNTLPTHEQIDRELECEESFLQDVLQETIRRDRNEDH